MAYGNVTNWIAYAADRGTTVVDDSLSAQALQRASDYIRTKYVLRMTGVDDDNSAIVEATYIAAGYELTKVGFWSKTYTPSQQKVLIAAEGIKWQATGGESGPDSALPVSPAIDALLSDLIGVAIPAAFTV